MRSIIRRSANVCRCVRSSGRKVYPATSMRRSLFVSLARTCQFDSSEVGNGFVEIIAYGTAAVVRPA